MREIIKRHENGASYAKISRDKEVPESTIRRLVKNKDELRKQSINSPSQNAKLATRIRSRAMIKMEHLLMIWIEHNVQNSIPMSLNCIKSEALILYEKVKCELCDKTENEVNETFMASTGWFEKFRNRIGLKNVVFNGEASSGGTKMHTPAHAGTRRHTPCTRRHTPCTRRHTPLLGPFWTILDHF